MGTNSHNVKKLENFGKARNANTSELPKSIVGMDDVIDEIMIAIFAQWNLHDWEYW